VNAKSVTFAEKVLGWFDEHGRKDLPWQQDINPYRVWISEIMLQQTQVKTVIPYYHKFMRAFPDIKSLANAPQDEVLKHWSGLGYYARARNMHKAAKIIYTELASELPNNLQELQNLPGIGRSTAAAILSLSHNQKQPILDGNVKRVLCRVFAVQGWPGQSAVLKKLWSIAEELVPDNRNADYTQAMMDLGATLCTRSNPSCQMCPLKADCLAHIQGEQSNFPQRKPKKVLPERHTVMLLIEKNDSPDTNHILMEKRPPVGIWGGLWCFPQFENRNAAQEWLTINVGAELNDATSYTRFSHTFSHFKLHIEAHKISVLKIPCETPIKLAVAESSDRLWYNIETNFEGGLAAPVQQLLNRLKKEQSNGTNG